MSEALSNKVCTPCRGGIPPLGRDEAARYLGQVQDWELVDEARRIERTFRFPDFRAALSFVDQVGAIAEAEAHHPDVCFGWGHAKISLQTKKIRGLHENDFIMAAKIDRLVAE
jgi:4a-hydroxytetrahydrobiopterin dehydratase